MMQRHNRAFDYLVLFLVITGLFTWITRLTHFLLWLTDYWYAS